MLKTSFKLEPQKNVVTRVLRLVDVNGSTLREFDISDIMHDRGASPIVAKVVTKTETTSGSYDLAPWGAPVVPAAPDYRTDLMQD